MSRNILFVTSDMCEGGSQRVISVLAKEMIRRGHKVEILLTEKKKKIAYALESDIEVSYLEDFISCNSMNINQRMRRIRYRLALKLRPYKVKETRLLYYYQNKADWLSRYFKNKKYDIIYSFLVESNIILGLSKKLENCKVVMAERNYPEKPEYEEYFLNLRNSCYSQANTCVFQTQEQAAMFPSDIQKKSVIIANPIKTNLPQPYTGLRRNVVVNYCGFREQKNLSLLIDAFAVVADRFADFTLELYGSGHLKDVLLEQIKLNGLEGRVFLYPFDPNIHDKVKDCAMFVMTSDYEGMPNSLIEAMGIGLPVISTDCRGGGAREVINNGVNGIIVPVGNEETLIEAMVSFITDKEKACSCAIEAVKIKERLSVKKIADQWIALID